MAARSSDIPGFYYDQEKKKYFKILPTHLAGKSVVTPQTIKDTQFEKQRLHDISKQNTLVIGKVIGTSSNRKWRKSLLPSLDRISTGQAVALRCFDTQSVNCVQNLTLKGTVDLDYGEDSIVLQMIAISTQNGVRLLQLRDRHSSKDIVSLQLKDCFRKSKQGYLKANVCRKIKCIVYTDSKSFSICPMKLANVSPSQTTICVARETSVYLQQLNFTSDDVPFPSFPSETLVDSDTVWSCASNSEWFSAGCERCAFVVRWTDSSSRTKLQGFGSCIYSQLFSNENVNLLYSATKKGAIYMNDLRGSRQPEYCLNQGACLFHMLQSTKEPHFLLASDSTGKIKLWDLRVRKSLQTYESVPQYLQNPFYMDSSERFVYGAGQDGYTRIWDFRTSNLLKSIPPPVPVTKSTIPRVHLVEPGSEHNRLPMLVTAVNNKLYFYR